MQVSLLGDDGERGGLSRARRRAGGDEDAQRFVVESALVEFLVGEDEGRRTARSATPVARVSAASSAVRMWTSNFTSG